MSLGTQLNRALANVAPGYAAKRAEAMAKTSIAEAVGRELGTISASSNAGGVQETRWRGASRVLRPFVNWITRIGSGNADLPANERRTLVARSRDAYRGHMLARAAVVRMRTNVVGTGLVAHPTVDAEALGITEEQATELNKLVQRRWRLWCENPYECDAEATLDFYGLQALALLSAMQSGDCVTLTPYEERPSGSYGLKVQLVESDRLANPNNAQNTATLVDGVELTALGMPVAMFINRRHPGDSVPGIDEWDRVPVFGPETGRRRCMLVLNDRDRIGQVRGAPFLAPILEPLQQIETCTRAELMAAVVSSLLTVFIKKERDQNDADGNPLPITPDVETNAATGDQTLSLGNGALVDLAPGESIETVNPARPNSKYDPFFISIVKQIGAALEIPLDELLLQYNASYSAARAAMLQAWRAYTYRRWGLVQQFCNPIYQLWFDEEVARGGIPVTNYADPARRAAYTQATWVGPARGSMDEEKEARAARARIDGGLSNETIEIAALMGEDRDTVYAQRKREVEQRRADNMELAPPTSTAPPPGSAPAPQEDATDEGDAAAALAALERQNELLAQRLERAA